MPSPKTPSPEQLYILLARAQTEGLDASVIERLTVILHFAQHRHSISETCRQFGISRSTFHRWIERFDPENLSSLADKSHEPLTLRQSAIDSESVELIRRYRIRYPQMGKERIAEILLLDHAVEISPSSVGRIIERNCLYFADTPFHWKKRLEQKASAPRSSETIIAEYQDSLTAVDSAHQPEIVPQHIVVEAENDDVPNESEHSVQSRPFSWQFLKRLIIVSCLITNIAFVSLLFGNALRENVSKPASSDIATETLHAAPATHYLP